MRILTEPQNALIKQYTAMLATEDVEISFPPESIREIAGSPLRSTNAPRTSARARLHTVMTALLEDILFDVPDTRTGKIEITAALVSEHFEGNCRRRGFEPVYFVRVGLQKDFLDIAERPQTKSGAY